MQSMLGRDQGTERRKGFPPWASLAGWIAVVALALVGFSLFQKRIMGLPLDQALRPEAFIVPVAFGGTMGALLGTYQIRLRRSYLDLEQSHRRLQAVMDTVPAGILLVDLDTQEIADANRFALELVGHQRAGLVGSVCHGHICPNERGTCPFAALDRERDCSERILLSACGERIPVLKTAAVLDLDGRRMLLECFLDLRERVAMEGRLRQAQRMEVLGKTAAGIVHDFNNILSAIQASLELLELASQENEFIRRQAAAGRSACRRGASLLKGLRSLGRTTPLDPRLMDLNQMVPEVRDLLTRLIPSGIELQIALWPEPLEVWGDDGQLGQVLLNLAVNARDAMPLGGSLTIATRPEGDGPGGQAVLEVRDTGGGIPPDHLPHIFEAFFTTKDPDRGSGLGLSIVKEIVEQHRGAIQVESRPGEGTLFRICLPLHADIRVSA